MAWSRPAGEPRPGSSPPTHSRAPAARYNGQICSRATSGQGSSASSSGTATASSQLVARAGRRSDAAVHQRRDEPVQGPVPRQGEARLHARDDRRRSACASAASTTTSTTSARRCGTTRSSRCSATSRFGDYFKTEAIEFAWRVLTEVWQLPPDRLYRDRSSRASAASRATTRRYDLWTALPARRRRSSSSAPADNFWQMGDTGPVRPLLGDPLLPRHDSRAPSPCAAASSAAATATSRSGTTCSWSSTASADGTLTPLPAPSHRHRHGARARHAPCIQGKLSNYDTDLFQPILGGHRRRCTGHTLRRRPTPSDVSMRVIADHLRAMTFLIGDGVVPSNEWRGYVLRKIMRRAMRHGKKLGLTSPFLSPPRRRRRRGDGRRLSRASPNRDDIVTVVRERGGAVRRRADGRPAQARGRARPRGRRHQRSCPATRCSGCTTRSACRSTSSRTSRASAALGRRSRRLRARDGGAARARARQQRVRGQEGTRSSRSRSTRRAGARCAALGRPLRGLRRTTRVDGAHRGAVRRRARPGRPSSPRARAATSCWTARRSTSRQAARCPTRARSTRRRPASARVDGDGTARAGRPARPRRPRHDAARCSTGDAVTRGRRRTRGTATRRNHTATHLLHAALRHGARHAREAGRLARRAGSPALRLRPLLADHARANSTRSSASSTSRSIATRRCRPT